VKCGRLAIHEQFQLAGIESLAIQQSHRNALQDFAFVEQDIPGGLPYFLPTAGGPSSLMFDRGWARTKTWVPFQMGLLVHCGT
jgi:hypothetical protein